MARRIPPPTVLRHKSCTHVYSSETPYDPHTDHTLPCQPVGRYFEGRSDMNVWTRVASHCVLCVDCWSQMVVQIAGEGGPHEVLCFGTYCSHSQTLAVGM